MFRKEWVSGQLLSNKIPLHVTAVMPQALKGNGRRHRNLRPSEEAVDEPITLVEVAAKRRSVFGK